MPEKIRYPAKLFKLLKNYPLLRCSLESCRKQLTPKVYLSGDKYPALESIKIFSKRRFCSRACAGAARAGKHSNAPIQARPAKMAKAPLEPEIKQELTKALRRHDPDLLEMWAK